MLGDCHWRWPNITTTLDFKYRVCWNITSFSGTQQSIGLDPTLFQCWSTVCDAGPALKQHLINLWKRYNAILYAIIYKFRIRNRIVLALACSLERLPFVEKLCFVACGLWYWEWGSTLSYMYNLLRHLVS